MKNLFESRKNILAEKKLCRKQAFYWWVAENEKYSSLDLGRAWNYRARAELELSVLGSGLIEQREKRLSFIEPNIFI